MCCALFCSSFQRLSFVEQQQAAEVFRAQQAALVAELKQQYAALEAQLEEHDDAAEREKQIIDVEKILRERHATVKSKRLPNTQISAASEEEARLQRRLEQLQVQLRQRDFDKEVHHVDGPITKAHTHPSCLDSPASHPTFPSSSTDAARVMPLVASFQASSSIGHSQSIMIIPAHRDLTWRTRSSPAYRWRFAPFEVFPVQTDENAFPREWALLDKSILQLGMTSLLIDQSISVRQAHSNNAHMAQRRFSTAH